MDWTGGMRRRFAKGKENAVLQRQKAHFAKMAKSRTAAMPPPDPVPPFMQEMYRSRGCEETHSYPAASRLSHATDRQRLSSQSRRHRKYSGVERPTSGSSSRRQQDSSKDGRGAASRNRQKLALTSSNPSAAAEDDSLAAQKRRLLARNDWLGLAAARPLRLNFKQNRDKDRIGKRRKVDKLVPRSGSKHHERVPTPLFQQQHMGFDALMSGALPNHDIQIKVGTDALDTQTQPSRRSRTPVATSIRPMSVASESLTEESMLLGVDEDGFAAGSGRSVLHRTFQPPARPSMVDLNEIVSSVGDQQRLQHNYGETLSWQGWSTPAPEQQCQISNTNFIGLDRARVVPAYGGQGARSPDPWDEDTSSSAHVDGTGPANVLKVNEVLSSNTPTNTPTVDEHRWQRALAVPQAPATQESVVALRSSSEHDSGSGASSWMRPVHVQADILKDSRVPEAAFKLGTILDDSRNRQMPVVPEKLPTLDTCTQPTPAEQDQINDRRHTAAKAPKDPEQKQDQISNDETLWKSFLVGSSSSASASRDGILRANTYESETLTPAPRSTSLSKSNDTRSDRVTLGNSNDYQENAITPNTNASSQNRTNTSLIGHATTAKPDDDVSTNQAESQRRRAANIHSSMTTISTRSRFADFKRKKQRAKVPDVERPFRSVIPTSTRATAHTKSVYVISSCA